MLGRQLLLKETYCDALSWERPAAQQWLLDLWTFAEHPNTTKYRSFHTTACRLMSHGLHHIHLQKSISGIPVTCPYVLQILYEASNESILDDLPGVLAVLLLAYLTSFTIPTPSDKDNHAHSHLPVPTAFGEWSHLCCLAIVLKIMAGDYMCTKISQQSPILHSSNSENIKLSITCLA